VNYLGQECLCIWIWCNAAIHDVYSKSWAFSQRTLVKLLDSLAIIINHQKLVLISTISYVFDTTFLYLQVVICNVGNDYFIHRIKPEPISTTDERFFSFHDYDLWASDHLSKKHIAIFMAVFDVSLLLVEGGGLVREPWIT